MMIAHPTDIQLGFRIRQVDLMHLLEEFLECSGRSRDVTLNRKALRRWGEDLCCVDVLT